MNDKDAMQEQLTRALAKLRDYKMSKWEKRAQAISFVMGNLMIDRPNYDAWMVAKWAAEAYDKRHEWQQALPSRLNRAR